MGSGKDSDQVLKALLDHRFVRNWRREWRDDHPQEPFETSLHDLEADLRQILPKLPLAKVRRLREVCLGEKNLLVKGHPHLRALHFAPSEGGLHEQEELALLKSEIGLLNSAIALRSRKDKSGDLAPSERARGLETPPQAKSGGRQFRSKALPELAQENPPQRFTHAEDYRSVTLDGKPFSLTSRQAHVIQILHEAHKSGNPELSGACILEKSGTTSSRLRDTFKSNLGAWEALIRPGKTKGSYRLNL